MTARKIYTNNTAAALNQPDDVSVDVSHHSMLKTFWGPDFPMFTTPVAARVSPSVVSHPVELFPTWQSRKCTRSSWNPKICGMWSPLLPQAPTNTKLDTIDTHCTAIPSRSIGS